MKILTIALLFSLCSFLIVQAEPQKIGFSTVYQTEDDWEYINQSVKDAIAEEGIVISYTSHAKDMLDRTGTDLGIAQDTYANAQIHMFCKVDLSHEMVQANPHIISGCPYGIAVYELKSNPGTVYMSYRNPPSNDVEPEYQQVEQLLIAIIETVLE